MLVTHKGFSFRMGPWNSPEKKAHTKWVAFRRIENVWKNDWNVPEIVEKDNSYSSLQSIAHSLSLSEMIHILLVVIS